MPEFVVREQWPSGYRPECSHKRCYTAESARKVAKQLRRNHDNKHVTAYRCRRCGWWHLGSSRGRN